MIIAVTGGSGFLGTALIRALIEMGHSVRCFSRKTSPQIQSPRLEVVHGDITRLSDVFKAFEGCYVVFHLAAKTSLWGEYEDFHSINVEGTKNVINACSERHIGILIYTSVWSAVFPNANQQGVNESEKYPSKYLAHYPKTKADAEKLVMKANSRHLYAVVLRPAPIWGPGDRSFSSRIIQKARKGTLRIIGDGLNLVDFIYLDNCVNAHLLALGRMTIASELGGRSYFLTDGQPIPIRDFIYSHLQVLNMPPLAATVSVGRANIEASKHEWLHKLKKQPGEPELTKFEVAELSCAHWYESKAALNDFGYTPAISIDQGMERFKNWYFQREKELKRAPAPPGEKKETRRAPEAPLEKKEREVKPPRETPVDKAEKKEKEVTPSREAPAEKKEKEVTPPREIPADRELKEEPIPWPKEEKIPPPKEEKKKEPPARREARREDIFSPKAARKQEITPKAPPVKMAEEPKAPVEAEERQEPVEHQLKHRETIFRIARGLHQTLDLKLVPVQILNILGTLINFCSGGIFLKKAGSDELYCAAATGDLDDTMMMQIKDPYSLPVMVVKKNEPAIVKDITSDPRFSSIPVSSRLSSALYIPIGTEGETLGCICLWTRKKEAFSNMEIESVTLIGQEAAQAIKNAELFGRLNSRMNFVMTLWALTKKLTDVSTRTSQSPKAFTEQMMETIKALIELDGMIFYQYNQAKKALIPTIFSGIFTDVDISDEEEVAQDMEVLAEVSPGKLLNVEFRSLIMDEQMISKGSLLDKPFHINNISENPRGQVFQKLSDAGNIMSLFWHPLFGREGIMGSLAFLAHNSHDWTDEEIQWSETFSSIFSLRLDDNGLSEEIEGRDFQLQALIESMPEGVFTTDCDRRVLIWNSSASKITGWSSKEAIGKLCPTFFKCQASESDIACAKSCPISQAFKKKDGVVRTIDSVTKQGEMIKLQLQASPIYGKRRKVTGSVVIISPVQAG